jgi:radical SAM superfamily enzyme YgiQ (UPF0313 family)
VQIKKITCIQFDGEHPDFCSRTVMPDYGLPVIATILAEAGYDVKVYVEHVKPPEWDRIAQSDLICFSSLNAGADKTYRLAQEIRSRLGIPIVIGGTHASFYPESCLKYCDYVVFGEGDETVLELVETLANGGNVENIAGIAYWANGIRRTRPRLGPARFDTVPNLSLIEGYRRLSLPARVVNWKKPWLTVQSSRGCRFNCSFCIVNTMFPGGYRKRDIESIIRDMRDKRKYGRELMFVDNEFAAMRSHTKKLLRRMIEENFDFDIVVFSRVEIAKDDELLGLMRRAGINYIYQGYESIRPETLVEYSKRQTLEEIVASIDKLHSFGFKILGSFVVGADSDTLESIRRTVDFVLERRLSNAYFFAVLGHFPEPGAGYQTLIPWYRSIFRGWGYYNGNFVTHFPLRMPPSKLQRAIIDAYNAIYSPAQIFQALKRSRFDDAASKLLLRTVWPSVRKPMMEYAPFLETLEEGLYDSDGMLRRDLLAQRVRRDPRWTFQAGNRTMEALGFTRPDLPSFVEGKALGTCGSSPLRREGSTSVCEG